jgi:hypothetical protein
MRLFFRRSQHAGGVFKGGVQIFALDARIELTGEEKDLIHKYQLQKEILYGSEDAKKHAANLGAAAEQKSDWSSVGKMLLSGALLALSLKCTVESLSKGQHIECKDVGELLAAEAALTEAAQRLKSYLEAAVSFDGREQLIDI